MSKATVTTSLGAAGAFMMALVPGSYAADPIKVGVVTPLSGSYAPIGKQVRWGAELAVKEINAAGGVKGRPFELLFEDEEANPPVAVRKSEKLLQQDKVDLLTGTVNSGSTLAVGQLAERNNRILRAVDHRCAMQSECVPGQRQCVHAVECIDRLAGEERIRQALLLHRSGLRDGAQHHFRVPG
jgi:hypothetical protein